MRAVPMIDNTALDSTATVTAGGNESETTVHSTLNELTFSRELPQCAIGEWCHTYDKQVSIQHTSLNTAYQSHLDRLVCQ